MGLTTSEILRTLEQIRPGDPAARGSLSRSVRVPCSGTAAEQSDVDFVVEFETKSFDAYMNLKAFLEQLFGGQVDLVLKDTIKPQLRERYPRRSSPCPGTLGSTSKTSWGPSRESADTRGACPRMRSRRTTKRSTQRSPNLEVVGEAVKRLPADLRARRAEIEWQKIAGLRDILIHAYFGVDVDILWDVISNKLEAVEGAVIALLRGRSAQAVEHGRGRRSRRRRSGAAPRRRARPRDSGRS